MNIVNVGYDSTNYYVLEQNNVRLLVDVGMPGTLPKLIDYLLCTHYHPDHAGIAQDVKAQGVRLLVLEPQLEAIPFMQGDTVVLIDDGEPAAALVPYALLEKWRKGRNEAFAAIDRIREKNLDLGMNEDELLAFIDESVQEVRRQTPT